MQLGVYEERDGLRGEVAGLVVDQAPVYRSRMLRLELIVLATLLASCGNGSTSSGGADAGTEPKPIECETDADCADEEICDPFLEPRLCASLSCTDSNHELCPTNYDCLDRSDDCNPDDGDRDCPGECVCGDACFPDDCETDADCAFGEFCVGEFPKHCWTYPCGANAEYTLDCMPRSGGCDEILLCAPTGSLCVDDPSTECRMADDPDCAGLCVPEPE